MRLQSHPLGFMSSARERETRCRSWSGTRTTVRGPTYGPIAWSSFQFEVKARASCSSQGRQALPTGHASRSRYRERDPRSKDPWMRPVAQS